MEQVTIKFQDLNILYFYFTCKEKFRQSTRRRHGVTEREINLQLLLYRTRPHIILKGKVKVGFEPMKVSDLIETWNHFVAMKYVISTIPSFP